MVRALALSRQRVVQNVVNKTSMRKSTVQGSCLRHSEQRVDYTRQLNPPLGSPDRVWVKCGAT